MNDHTVERWLPVVGFEGAYEVSDFGNVRSLTRKVWSGDRYVTKYGRALKPYPNTGNMQLTLYLDGKKVRTFPHVLVMEAFVGPRPEGMEVCHNNGDWRDNQLSNLRYDNHISNMLDSIEHNTHYYASRDHCKHGHEYTPENTRRTAREPGRRICRTCDTTRARAYREKRQRAA